jgi:hypothetical protein
MVRVADIEGLFKKYLEEGRIECADALYLCAKLGEAGAAEALRIRYGIAAPLTSTLEDVKQLGIGRPSSYEPKTEDTGECARDVIVKTFESLCLDKFAEEVEKKAEKLSPLAKECLFLLAEVGADTFRYWEYSEHELFRKLYKFIFKKELDEKHMKKAFEELVRCGILLSSETSTALDLFDALLVRIRRFLPRVEVNIHWLEK